MREGWDLVFELNTGSLCNRSTRKQGNVVEEQLEFLGIHLKRTWTKDVGCGSGLRRWGVPSPSHDPQTQQATSCKKPQPQRR